MKLCEKTARRLRNDGREAWAMSCVWSSRSGGNSRNKRYGVPLWDTQELFREALQLVGGSFAFPVEFLAITVMDLRVSSGQLSLWEEKVHQRDKDLTSAIDYINNQYGEYALMRGSMWGMQEFAHDRIGFRKTVRVERSTKEP